MRTLVTLAGLFVFTTACQSQDRAAELPLATFAYDRSQPISFESRSEAVRDGVETQAISYASPRGGRATGVLFVPQGPGPESFSSTACPHAPGT